MDIVVEVVSAVWRKSLDGATGEPEENFFDLGGTSMKAAMMVAELRELGIDVPLRAFFDDGRLAAIIERAKATM